MSFEDHLNRVVKIERRENLGTNFHPVYDWDVLASVYGLVNLLSSSEVVRDEGGVVLADYVLYIEWTDVKLKDRIKDDDSGNNYNIFSIHDPNGLGHHLKIKMKLLPQGFQESGS